MHRIEKVMVLIFISGLALFLRCSKGVTSPEEDTTLINFSEIGQKLEQAYQRGSQSSLDTVFTMWQKAIRPYSTFEIAQLSDTVKHVYEVFQIFYSPNNLNRITGGTHENFETNFRYVVVQNRMQCAIVDTNPKYYYYQGVKIREREIHDFRPQPEDKGFPVVYLSTVADSMIYQYLYQSDGKPKPDHQQRVSFLRKAIQLTHHHWINDYHKVTMPEVSRIYINENLIQALVMFRVFYQFGNAYLEWSNNRWNLMYSKLTAIE